MGRGFGVLSDLPFFGRGLAFAEGHGSPCGSGEIYAGLVGFGSAMCVVLAGLALFASFSPAPWGFSWFSGFRDFVRGMSALTGVSPLCRIFTTFWPWRWDVLLVVVGHIGVLAFRGFGCLRSDVYGFVAQGGLQGGRFWSVLGVGVVVAKYLGLVPHPAYGGGWVYA